MLCARNALQPAFSQRPAIKQVFSINKEAIAGLEEMGRRFLALSYPSLSLFKEATYFFSPVRESLYAQTPVEVRACHHLRCYRTPRPDFEAQTVFFLCPSRSRFF